jgi:hypothetical protein
VSKTKAKPKYQQLGDTYSDVVLTPGSDDPREIQRKLLAKKEKMNKLDDPMVTHAINMQVSRKYKYGVNQSLRSKPKRKQP